MRKEVVAPPGVDASALPFSPGLKFGNLLFLSGNVGSDPTTGKIVEGGIKAQTRQTLENLKAIVEAAGSSLDKALKAGVFLTDMEDFAGMNEVFRSYFPSEPPTRSTVEISALAAPDAVVEIDLIVAL